MYLKNFLSLVIITILLLSPVISGAQTLSREEQEAIWRAELEATEKEIAEWQNILNTTKRGTASLQREADILNAKIKEAQAFIRQRNLSIEKLTRDINTKAQTITELENKIERGQESLAQLIRKTNEIDSYSLLEIILANRNLSDFFADLDSFNSVKREMHDLFIEIRNNKNLTQAEKEALAVKQSQEVDNRMTVEAQKRQVEKDEKEKQDLIKVNKTQEKTYSDILAERQARASAIRAELFRLRDTDGISFGDALNYANEAEKITGVRAAFILGILKQESNIGQNVGSCVITDLKSGSTQGVNTGKVFANGIHPTRDLPVLQSVLADLGRDPLVTRVSCPLSVGYGGAMGPAQFIPSTWNMYINKLKDIVGAHPDPWNPRHAFIASGLLLADNGASAGGYTAEHTAAAKYYAGGNWRTLGQSYANSVMRHTQDIQENMINPLNF